MSLTFDTCLDSPAKSIYFPNLASRTHGSGFPSGQRDRRLESLQDACRVLADGFEDLDESIAQYLAEAVRSPYDSDADDVANFLQWLAEQDDLTPEQRDYVACQQSWQAVERVVLRRRLAHVRFQEMLRTPAQRDGVGLRTRCTVHLNPVHVWATFESHAIVGEESELPATVVVYPVGTSTRALVVDETVADMIRRLEHGGPLPLQQLLRTAANGHRDELRETIIRLAELGLLAVAS